MFRAENAQSLLGLAVILGLCWALSENRRVFPWKLAAGALLIQLLLVLGLFGLPPLEDAEIALLKARGGAPRAADRLAEFILASLDRRAGRPAA